ncbi:MAG TPA: PAS domain S-box protein [Sedimentisphaerales bacterium]|nr:PAS domain S-box protein [Sedimentisphaerales bacterium]
MAETDVFKKQLEKIKSLETENNRLKEEIVSAGKLQQQLMSEKARYLSLIDCSTDVVWRINLDGVFTFVSKEVERMIGYKPEELVGKSINIVLRSESSQKAFNSLEKRNKGTLENKSYFFEFTHVRKDGSEFPCEVRTSPILNSEGDVVEIQGFSRDITNIKAAEEKLDLYREQMGHAKRLAMLVTISATVAHELNQPLTVIRLLLQDCLLELSKVDNCEKVAEDINDSLIEIQKASRVIQRFRDVAKPSYDIAKEYQDDGGRILDKIVGLMSKTAIRSNMQLIISSNVKEVLSRAGNSFDIEQVFFIMIENAIQAAAGQKNRQLKINGYIEDDSVVLTFADDCGGISQSHVGEIFKPFFTTKPDGTGLGLCIVKRILDVIGGKISVENKPGIGVTFYVKIPTNTWKERSV